MGDTIQVVIVTAVAGVALVALVRPYLRRREGPKTAPPCANCAASASSESVRKTAARASTHH